MTENNESQYSAERMRALKEQARKSGLTYNEAIEWIARKTGGHGTHIYSDTDVEAVKEQITQSELNKNSDNQLT